MPDTGRFIRILRVSGGSQSSELLTATGTNSLSSLSSIPTAPTSVIIYVNGKPVDTLPGSGISVSGTALTVDSSLLGYSILPTDRITTTYF